MLKKMSTLAVVIPLFNHSAFIAATLDSVYAQTHPPTRVIVIDDGSTDDSVAQARRFARPGTEIICQKNRGAHATLNRGVELAEDCEWVAILNSDDLWAPQRLERCLSFAQKNLECAVVVTRLHLVDPAGGALTVDSGKVRRHQKIWSLVEKENDPLLSLAVSNFGKTTSNLVARRSFLLEERFTNYRYVHDYHFFLRAALHGKLAVLKEDLLGYRVHPSNTIKADGRRAVVAETVQMHLDLLGKLAPQLAESAILRCRLRRYLQRLFGNHTDFRSELFVQMISQAVAAQPGLFQVGKLGDYTEFESKSEPLPE